MPRSLKKIPDYFTEEEAIALLDAAASYPTRMAFRIMLKTGRRARRPWCSDGWTCALTRTHRSSWFGQTHLATRAGRSQCRLT